MENAIPIISVKPEGDAMRLQEKFETAKDSDGIREVLVIGNERESGCPFKCVGCGVHEEAATESIEENAETIKTQLLKLQEKLKSNEEEYVDEGYHLAIYNYGNVTNKNELSRDNLDLLLEEINRLSPTPSYVSINSRGLYIKE